MSVQVCLETVNSLSTPDCHTPENIATLKKKSVHKLRDGFNCQLTHNCFTVFFPITDIATYRLNMPRGQFI